MDVVIMTISILLITIVLLQSGKAESASQILGGGSSELFSKRKERGSELFITRLTLVLGAAFFIICLIISF
ncbi:MAG TPA: preprotein translocase subunit SecG [Bacilli bacterium]|nr:preprotein translocase subunit SecG [Bacilli bacterium]